MKTTPQDRACMAAEVDALVEPLKALGAVKLLDFYCYEKARYPSALQDVIPAEFYSERDAAQAIAMVEAVMRCVERNWHKGGMDTEA